MPTHPAWRAYSAAVALAARLNYPTVPIGRITFGPGPARYLGADDLLRAALASDPGATRALARLADELARHEPCTTCGSPIGDAYLDMPTGARCSACATSLTTRGVL